MGILTLVIAYVAGVLSSTQARLVGSYVLGKAQELGIVLLAKVKGWLGIGEKK